MEEAEELERALNIMRVRRLYIKLVKCGHKWPKEVHFLAKDQDRYNKINLKINN